MPGRQVIVYDKRAEAIAKGKSAWWTIWNNKLSRAGLPSLRSEVAAESQVWRVELRAGKAHLKDRWAVRTWIDLDARFVEIASHMLHAVRHTEPTSDTNRSRWPDSRLWSESRQNLSADLFETCSTGPPDLIKRVQLEAHDNMLSRQIKGILTTKAALRGLGPDDLAGFAVSTGQVLGSEMADPISSYARKLKRAKKKFAVIPTS